MEPITLVVSDIDNFWRAFDLAEKAPKAQRAEIYQREYFDKGTVGLQKFIKKRIESAESLAETVDRCVRYYRSVRPITLQIGKISDAIKESCRRLTEYYPNPTFQPVYFVVGKMNSAGTQWEDCIFVGVEFFGRTETTPLEELSEWHRQAITIFEAIPNLVVHELMHSQQRYPDEWTVLAQAIREGAADYVGLVVNSGATEISDGYGDTHEEELWRQFRQEMYGVNCENWFGDTSMKGDRPPDMGYYIGSKICESYFKRSSSKKQAIHDIFNIKDFTQFLKHSGYSERFPDDHSGP